MILVHLSQHSLVTCLLGLMGNHMREAQSMLDSLMESLFLRIHDKFSCVLGKDKTHELAITLEILAYRHIKLFHSGRDEW